MPELLPSPVLGAAELWKAGPVQEFQLRVCRRRLRGHVVTTADVERKLTRLHRWLQKPPPRVFVLVRINVTRR